MNPPTADPAATRAALEAHGAKVHAMEEEPGRWLLQLTFSQPQEAGAGLRAWGFFTHGTADEIWERAAAWLARREGGQAA